MVGLLFVISGTVKLMDPVGSGLVMDAYWSFMHLSFLHPISKVAGIAFALLETFTGIALVTGIWRKLTAVVASGLMFMFTLLTAALALFNPNMDCGCFGEILHLTHLQSLLKNIVIDAFLAVAFLPFRDFGEPRKLKYGAAATVALSMVALLVYSLLYIPVRDYTSYKEGARLSSALGEDGDVMFDAVFIYEKDGEQKTFTLNDELPDESWTFIGSETVPNKDISSLPVLPVTVNGESADSLASEGDVIVLSIYNTRRFNEKKKAAADAVVADAEAAGFRTLVLSIDPREELGELKSDYRALIGLNRSNGGLTLIQDGYIIRKWARRSYPSFEDLQELKEGEATETLIERQTKGDLLFQAYLLYVYSILLLL